jgi:drug/metabolite transporter (DMT)-like permease
MGSGLVALIVGLQPVLTALWTSWQGAKVTGRQWVGLVLGLAGLALVVGPKIQGGHEISSASLLLAVVALLSITTGTLYQKRFVAPCDVRSANAVQLLAAWLVTAPLALWLEHQPMVWTLPQGGWNSELCVAMAWSVLGLTLGGSSLLYLLIQKGAATRVTSLFYLVPPTTALMAWLLFSEPITLPTVVGMALTAWGVSFVVRATKS